MSSFSTFILSFLWEKKNSDFIDQFVKHQTLICCSKKPGACSILTQTSVQQIQLAYVQLCFQTSPHMSYLFSFEKNFNVSSCLFNYMSYFEHVWLYMLVQLISSRPLCSHIEHQRSLRKSLSEPQLLQVCVPTLPMPITECVRGCCWGYVLNSAQSFFPKCPSLCCIPINIMRKWLFLPQYCIFRLSTLLVSFFQQGLLSQVKYLFHTHHAKSLILFGSLALISHHLPESVQSFSIGAFNSVKPLCAFNGNVKGASFLP